MLYLKHDRSFHDFFLFFFQIGGHINFFPAQESHFSRKDNSGKQFLKEDLSVQRMNNLYLEENEPEVC